MVEVSRGPKVGVGGILRNNENEILLIKRKRNPEKGHWILPGGKVELWETIEDAIIRELQEELGVIVEIKHLACVVNHIAIEDCEHWVAPIFECEINTGTIQNMEEDSIEEIQWYKVENFPQPLAETLKQAIKYL